MCSVFLEGFGVNWEVFDLKIHVGFGKKIVIYNSSICIHRKNCLKLQLAPYYNSRWYECEIFINYYYSIHNSAERNFNIRREKLVSFEYVWIQFGTFLYIMKNKIFICIHPEELFIYKTQIFYCGWFSNTFECESALLISLNVIWSDLVSNKTFIRYQ